MDAHALLTALQDAGLPIDGFTIRDPADPITWTFYGDAVTPAIAAQAVQIIQAATHAPSSVASWPIPDPLGDRVTALETVIAQLGE